MEIVRKQLVNISEKKDTSDFNMYPDINFLEQQKKLLEKYREELDCYREKDIREAINMFLYTGYLSDPSKSFVLDKFLKKFNLKNGDDKVIPLLAKQLKELREIVEPLPNDVIIYYGLYENVVGVSLNNNFVKSDNMVFHPLCAERAVPIKLFSGYGDVENPRDYIIRNLGFINGTTNLDWSIRYHAQKQSENYDTVIALRVPKGTPVLLADAIKYNQDDNEQLKQSDYYGFKTFGKVTLFPDTTFVVYDKINVDYYLFEKAIQIYFGGVCDDLKDISFGKPFIKRIYRDNNYTFSRYGRDFDEQADRARKYIYHETKSYEGNVIYAFPQITSKTNIPTKFMGKSFKEINENLRKAILNGRGKHWTNQQLSYMRKELFSQAIFNEIKGKFDPGEKIHIVDATGNIGGDSLLFALQKEVSWVLTYEMNPDTFKLLENNIELYGLHQIVAVNEKFSATEEKIFRGAKLPNTVVIIDPPYEYPTGAEKQRFVYSIDNLPLIYMIGDCLNAGAEMVVVTVPLDFTFNRDYAEKRGISVDCYTMGKKDMKIYMAWKSSRPKFYSGMIKMPTFK